jgi:predicted MFS family arabinose efflux permease
LLVTIAIWPRYGHAREATTREARSPSALATMRSRENILLIVCYGCFGFGYIIPATFIPALARAAVPDPQIFGWAWPVFGTAALISTLVAGPLSARVGYRRLWSAGQFAMAAGVALPGLWSGMTAVVACALCVGGTFVVVTMAGMQEARRVAPEQAGSLMAAMTAAFAGGQILGPVLVSLAAGHAGGMQLCLLVAAAVLAASAVLLAHARRQATAS